MKTTKSLVFIFFVIAALLTVLLRQSFETDLTRDPVRNDFIQLPNPNTLRIVSLGNPLFLADLYLIRAQVFLFDHDEYQESL